MTSPAPTVKPGRLFINNEWKDAANGATFETTNPATGAVITTIAKAGKEDVDAAVMAARDAFEGKEWNSYPASKRGELLWKIGELVMQHADEIAYLCDAANRYFRERVEPADVVRAITGANAVKQPKGGPLAPDSAMTLDHGRGMAPLLTIHGGDLTMARERAEVAVSRLTPFYPMSPRWTADAVLPGGDFPWAALDDQVDRACERWGFLGERHARRLVEAYGTRIDTVLGDARSREQLGPIFGEDLTGVEVRHLMTREWARFPDDVLWRRSKLGLTMPEQDRQALAEFMANPAAT